MWQFLVGASTLFDGFNHGAKFTSYKTTADIINKERLKKRQQI